jgi:hypothetical protein
MDSVQNRQENRKNQGIQRVLSYVAEARFCSSHSWSTDCKGNGVWGVLTVVLTDFTHA